MLLRESRMHLKDWLSWTKIVRRYRLKDGGIYWHRLYYDLMPKFMCNHSLPGIGGYNLAHYLIRPHEIFMDYGRQVKWFWQRGTRGWADQDAWGWYSHHSVMMVGVLQYLRKYKHGYPIGLTPGKWAKKLKAMEEGFQAAIDEENDVTSYKKLPMKEYRKLIFKRRRKLMLGLKYFRAHYYSLWD